MSDWKKGAAARRDARRTKAPDEVGKPRAVKKDTKRWCGGKVGREHKLKCMPWKSLESYDVAIFRQWRVLACTICGKVLDDYSPSSALSSPKPEWVTS